MVDDVKQAIKLLREQRPEGEPIDLLHEMFTSLPPVFAVPEQHMAAPPTNSSARLEEIELEVADEEERKECEDHDEKDGSNANAAFAALLEACRIAGFDSDHEKRKELVAILQAVQQGEDFPAEIILPVVEKTKLTEKRATKMLKPQVQIVIEGMENAIQAEEERRAELLRLTEEERVKREQKYQEWLRAHGPCPAGYSWHREVSGWRCAGGSHYRSQDQLPNYYTQ